MLNGKCLILFIETMELLTDVEGVYLVFRNEAEAREYAKMKGFLDYIVAGLADQDYPGLPTKEN